MLSTQIIEFDHVYKRFHEQVVLRDVCMIVKPGQKVCVIGPSGAGKSTLLRCCNYLTSVDAGSVRFEGETVGVEHRNGKLYERREREVARMRARIGMVFQNGNLYGHMTALANITHGLRLFFNMGRDEADERGHALLARVGLDHKAASYPAQLSGGERQRVAIARAIASDPPLILFDEPTSALDVRSVQEVLAVMQDLSRSGITMLIVTHELRFAREVADEIVFMDRGEVVETATPDQLLDAPSDPRARAFLRGTHSAN